jgi:hypothetical protein
MMMPRRLPDVFDIPDAILIPVLDVECVVIRWRAAASARVDKPIGPFAEAGMRASENRPVSFQQTLSGDKQTITGTLR